MSLLGASMTTNKSVVARYMALDQGAKSQILYVWVDSSGEKTRAKTRTMKTEPKTLAGEFHFYSSCQYLLLSQIKLSFLQHTVQLSTSVPVQSSLTFEKN